MTVAHGGVDVTKGLSMASNGRAEVFPPGEFIRDELHARDWTQEDFAKIINRPLKTLDGILNGRIKVTPNTAMQIGTAFGTGPELWLNLESAYRLSLAQSVNAEIAR